MKARIYGGLGVVILAMAVALEVWAITTVQVKVVCPISKTKNDFYDYASWGTYVYAWPSKFQMVFWPHTDPVSLYSCKKCRLTVWMWDFREFPKDKIEATRSVLAALPASASYKSYLDAPMSEKLGIAEKVYRELGRGEEFWCHFHRVTGYHLAREGKHTEAAEARARALEIAQTMLAKPENEGIRKELLVMSAAMRHFLGRNAEALEDLQTAAKLTFLDPKIEKEKSENADRYLTSLIEEYIQAIQAGTVPDDVKPE